ncbi:hypothetical protein SAMN05216210_0804 [Halopseudomonas salegens]|uniref:Uncharacterized protein n=1 Tax=Halopseudomonas salegens TaxID=1434072 RepID=A0A1H2EKD1_9GAMM|nr:hypothetical protein SAMN05216210_0804 [Halopseudomonas salegens]
MIGQPAMVPATRLIGFDETCDTQLPTEGGGACVSLVT